MTIGIRLLTIAATCLLATAAFGDQDITFKVPMNHTHTNTLIVVGNGTLELNERRLVWTETKSQTGEEKGLTNLGNPKHSFAVSCGQIESADLGFPKFSAAAAYNLIKLRVLGKTYQLQSHSGWSAAVILDQIRLGCRMGDPVLESSKTVATRATIPSDNTGEHVAFDVFYVDHGGRGVLFVTRTGVVYEQISVHQLDWESGHAVGIGAARPVSFPCSSLSDITVRGSTGGGFFVKSNSPELDIHDGDVSHRFSLGANIYGQAVKQAIADYCSR